MSDTPPSTPAPIPRDLTIPPPAPTRVPGQGFGLDSGELGAAAPRADIFAALTPRAVPVTPDRDPEPDLPQRDGAKRQLEFDPEEDEGAPDQKKPRNGGSKRRKSKKRKSKRRKNKKSKRNKRR